MRLFYGGLTRTPPEGVAILKGGSGGKLFTTRATAFDPQT